MTTWGHSDFGALLRRHRRRCGLSQQALAERAGLSVDAVAALERGRRRTPRPFTVQALSDAMSLDPDDRSALIAAAAPDESASTSTTSASVPYVQGTFVGRDDDVRALSATLVSKRNRVISLVGPAGVGKSRLGVEVARVAASSYTDGVRWLTLMSVSRPGAVAAVVAAGLGIGTVPGSHPVDVLRDGVGDRDQLLVLDNCEHVLAECVAAIEALLLGGPGLHVLVTSRERLRVPGELSWPVLPLAVPRAFEVGGWPPVADAASAPAAATAHDLAVTSDSPAVRLFLDRAREIAPGFDPPPLDVLRIGQICRRLDGLPLAVELAASRTSVLSVAELLDGIDASLAVLGSIPRGTTPQHASLDAAIEWSMAELRPRERGLLAVLAMFVGGASRGAIEAVRGRCGDPNGGLLRVSFGDPVGVPGARRPRPAGDEVSGRAPFGYDLAVRAAADHSAARSRDGAGAVGPPARSARRHPAAQPCHVGGRLRRAGRDSALRFAGCVLARSDRRRGRESPSRGVVGARR